MSVFRTRCSFIPPYLLRRLAGPAAVDLDRRLRLQRAEAGAADQVPRAAPAGGTRVVHTASNTETLPGQVARSNGDPATGDPAVDEAYASAGAVLDLFAARFGRTAIDGRGTPVSITVHFGTDYDNAFWDGTQLVFGDGDGVVFGRFTRPLDVLAHEFTHGVVQYTAGLAYEGQPGALNESVSDVFAALTRQQVRGETAERADWLIGAGLFLPGVEGRALRSMLEPGTAYDDTRIGRDPQVATMADYVTTTDDNGGVHINSGIPNRAFALAAVNLGGPAWERAGRVWYDALTAGEVTAESDFATFARATVSSARRVLPGDPLVATQIAAAWRTVGVLGDPSTAGGVEPAGEPAPTTVAVRRTGGIAGTVRTGELDLDADPDGPEVRTLLLRVRVQRITVPAPAPDRFVYTVQHGQWQLTVAERDLTPELRRVVTLVLASPARPDRGSGADSL